MRLILITLLTITLAACSDPPRRVVDSGNTRSIVETIYDYGTPPELDGCSVKYVITRRHPDFWIVRCPNSLVSTEYETGSKSKTKIGSAIN